MNKWVVKSEASLNFFLTELKELLRTKHALEISVKIHGKRSLDQNAISHAWYEEIARRLTQDDVLGWKCFCKLNFGIPILYAEDEQFRKFYDQSLAHLTYEDRLKAMKYVPVTSVMNKPQMAKYLQTLQQEFWELGVKLEFPED